MRFRVRLGLCFSLLVAPLTAAAEAGVELGAWVRARQAENPCDKGSGDHCIPADIVAFSPFAFRAGRWDLQSAARRDEPTQFTVGLYPDIVVHSRGFTTRSRLIASLGGGQSGLEWHLGGVWMFGGRLSLGEEQRGGPFARVGLDTRFTKNGGVYLSHIELPRFEVGYQYINSPAVFLELAGRSGLMLAGRHHVIDPTRDIGFSLDAGFLATLQLGYLRLQADAVRIFETEHAPEAPIDRGEADVCGVLGGVALCLTGSLERTEVWVDGQAAASRANFIGGKIGLVDARIYQSRRVD